MNRSSYLRHHRLSEVVLMLGGLAASSLGCGTDEHRVAPTPGQDTYIEGIHHFVPDAGFVPDSATATRIARAVLTGIYGLEVVKGQEPLRARLENEQWTVDGTLAANRVGGVGIVVLSKRDGRIIRVSHGQ